MNCLVALPVAVEQMRAAGNATEIPDSMISRTRDAFDKLASRPPSSAFMVAAGSQDLLYQHIAALTMMDRYTTSYFAQVVRYFFMQLSGRNVRTFYVLDNSLRDDRLAAILKLFDLAGISTFTPAPDHLDWKSLSGRIRQRLEMVGHVAYIEPDGKVNFIQEAQHLAREAGCVATFRNLAPEDKQFQLVSLPKE